MQVSRNVIVASIQVDLEEDVLARFQEDLLLRLQETNPRAVIFDVAGLETLDAHEFSALRRIMTILKIMGTESLLVGLQPGIVSALIEVGTDPEGLKLAIDLDAAFELLEQSPDPEPDFIAELEVHPDPFRTTEGDSGRALFPDSEWPVEDEP